MCSIYLNKISMDNLKISENNEDDDDTPTLSRESLIALEEFYKELHDKENIKELITSESSINSFDENWQLSQFWYNEETISSLSEEAVRAAGSTGYIALISCPSLYQTIKNNEKFKNGRVVLFEYDKRFSVYGNDFIFFDYNKFSDIPRHLEHSFDVVVADPPFLSEECLEKTSQAVKFLAKDKIIFCTGAVMESSVANYLNLKKTSFLPHHRNNLANEFNCFTNYDEFEHYISSQGH